MLFLASLLSGAIGGMGIGGGAILIPVLTSFFDIGQKDAQFINLIYFIPVAICALIVHFKEKRLDRASAIIMIISGIPGALAGSEIASLISTALIRRVFGVFLFVIGIMQFKRQRKD